MRYRSKVEALIKERIEAIQNEGLEKPLIEKDRLFKVKKEYKMDKLYYNILSYCKELYPIKESTLRNHLNNENWEKATKYVERKKVEHKGYGNLHKLDILIKKIEAYKQQFESQKWGWFSKDRTSIIWSNELK